VDTGTRGFNDAKKTLEARVADLNLREKNLQKELDDLGTNREELASVVDETTRSKYERLLKQKGRNVVVGIQHGVCGGCHMQLSRSIIVGCQGDQEIMSCPNCSRILFYTPDMDLAVAEEHSHLRFTIYDFRASRDFVAQVQAAPILRFGRRDQVSMDTNRRNSPHFS